MQYEKVYSMDFKNIYPLLVGKAARKGRSEEEVMEIICWLTGYTPGDVRNILEKGMPYGDFFLKAPCLNPDREKIRGTICGTRIEEIDEPLMKEIRCLDKMVDELAKGRPMDRILRR